MIYDFRASRATPERCRAVINIAAFITATLYKTRLAKRRDAYYHLRLFCFEARFSSLDDFNDTGIFSAY